MKGKTKKRLVKTAEEMLKEAKLILEGFPDGEKIRDPVDGRKLLTKQEVLEKFEKDDDFAVKLTSMVFGLKFDLFIRRKKR